MLHDKEIIWEHFVSVYKRDTLRTFPVTKLNHDAIFINNFSKMRVNLAVHALSESVAEEMKQNENEATKSTQIYIKKCSEMFEILNSELPIKDDKDPRIQQLSDIKTWFLNWETELEHQFIIPSEIQNHRISWQTIEDVHLTISSLIDLVKYISREDFRVMYPSAPYIIPKRLNQDIVESWFSHQRGCCGDNREPTVMQYGCNSTKLLSLKKSKNDIAVTNYGPASLANISSENNYLHIAKKKKTKRLQWSTDLN